MSRENKYRAWDNVRNKMWEWNMVSRDIDLGNILSGKSNLKPLQYTGLKDKNGVEIYEGDIIASQNSDRDNWYVSHHEVVWHDAGLQAKQICSNGSRIGLSYWTRGENGYVVIGNIYENPELLEASK